MAAAGSQAPFYAIKLAPGDIGTQGGLVTNANGQVVNTKGKPIAGLCTTGNGIAAITVPLTSPPAIRGRLVALVQLCNNIISLSLGAYLVALLARTYYPGPTGLGSAMLVIALFAGPSAWLLFYLAWKPYRRAVLLQP